MPFPLPFPTAIAVKKFVTYRKDKLVINDINIMINYSGEPKPKFNNVKYNKPLTDIIVISIITSLMVGWLLVFIIYFNVNFGPTPDYIYNFWYGWAGNIFFRTIIPIWIVTFCMKDFRNFIKRTIWPQDNQISPIN